MALRNRPRRRDSRNVMRSFVPEGVRRIAQRVSWTVGDQILSALSNLLLAVLVARTADAAGFGAFSMAFLVFSIMIGLTRAAVGQPLQISFAAAATRQFRSAVRSALGGATLIGVFTGAVVGAFGLALGGETGSALIAVAVCLPGLLVQDTCRMAFFAAGMPKRAAAIDALWSGLLFALLAVVIALAMDQIWIPIAIWGATAAAAALYGMHLLEAIPRIRGAVSWLLAQRKLTGYLIAEYFLGQGIAQIGILAVAIVGTEEGVGALRAAQVLIGPLNILGAAAFMFAIPEIARRPQMSQRSRGVFCAGVSSAMGVATAIYCIVLLAMPDSIGESLLDDTWTGAASVLLATCLLSFFAALSTGPATTLDCLGMARATFMINIIHAPMLVIFLSIGISSWGAVGAAWALAATEIAILPFWVGRVVIALRKPQAPITSGSLSIVTRSGSTGPENESLPMGTSDVPSISEKVR